MKVFLDRADAGRQLAKKLGQYCASECVVFGLPTGGVVTAKEVSEALGAPLDIIVVRKLAHPGNPEFAVGAITVDGEAAVNVHEAEWIGKDWLVAEEARQMREAQRRERLYLTGHQTTSVKGKIAIVVDDGMATGYTMEAAVRSVRRREPSKVVVAVPVAEREALRRFEGLADEVVTVDVPEHLFAVGHSYVNFGTVSDDAVIELIREAIVA